MEKIKTLQKQINALDNLLDNMPYTSLVNHNNEVVLFKLRMQIFNQLKELKSTARNSVNN